MKAVWVGVLAGCWFATAPVHAQNAGKREQAAMSASPDVVAESVGIQGFDDLDTAFELSTQPFLPSKSGHDQFLRATIKKRTGATEFQVYLWTEYNGDWKSLSSATYESPYGPVEAEAINLGRKVLACDRWGCLNREDIVFDVPETLLRAVSAGATGGSGAVWRYKVSGKFGDEPPLEMLKTEMAGLLIKVDQLRRSQKLPVPAAK